MEFVIEKQALLDALDAVVDIIPSRTTLISL